MSKILRIPFGQSVRELRQAIGLSQEAFADRCGLARSYLRANEEVRALAGRYHRYRATHMRQREEYLQERIGELLEERLDTGYEGLSARDVWSQLGTEAKGISGVFQHINLVLAARRG